MWQDLAAALCLVLVIEGILPFLNPRGWQASVLLLARIEPRRLRLLGLASMVGGAALLYWVRHP
jgi:uncharacterized protein YjeT (DUF2065 family)